MGLVNDYRAFVINKKILGEEFPEIEEIIENELNLVESIKREDLIRKVEREIKIKSGLNVTNDNLATTVSNHLDKLKIQGKAENSSGGIWKAL